MKTFATSLLLAAGILAASVTIAQAAPPSVNGTWSIEQTGVNGTSSGTFVIKQSGNGIVATNAKNGMRVTGEFASDTQVNAKWNSSAGAGWLTIYVSPNGHSFNGTWGYNGRKANGSFVGNKVLPPSPVTAAGKWKLKGAGNAGGFVGPMSCKQSGPTVVCHIGSAIVLNGKFRTSDKVRATWTSSSGSGWFSFWFNDDNNSFNGVWGNGADSTPPVGRVVGQRSL